MNDAFIWPVRVYIEDTDAGGVVFYANFLRYMERARTEMLHARGVDHAAMIRDENLMFVVRRCEIDYLKPARLGDDLTVISTITKIGGASVQMEQNIEKSGVRVAEAKIVLVCVTSAGQACRIPATILGKIG